jgi:sphingomyelin phosphodiesterase 2
MIPSSLAHRIISTHGLVTDSWLSAYPNTADIHPPGSNAQYNIEKMGATCDSILNTWRMQGTSLPPPDTVDPRAKRLDYVFHSSRNSSVRNVTVGMTKPMTLASAKGGRCSLSDHFAVEVQLALAPDYGQQQALVSARNPEPIPSRALVDIAGAARAEEAELTGQVGGKEHERYLDTHIIDEIFAVHAMYAAREVKEKKWRIGHFFASIVALVGLHVGVWWSPHNGVAFALMFISWVVAVTGVIDGLIGFLFTGSGTYLSQWITCL